MSSTLGFSLISCLLTRMILAVELRRLFSIDPDFSESMFLKQIAVCKGQGYNLVQSLENQDEGNFFVRHSLGRKLTNDVDQVLSNYVDARGAWCGTNLLK